MTKILRNLFVLHAHEEVMKGRQTVTEILRKYVTCKNVQGRPLLPPPSPDLPEFRVNMSQSFQTTGLDFAGP